MNNKKKLLLDMDGILANFRRHTVERINLIHKRNYPLDDLYICSNVLGDHQNLTDLTFEEHLDPLWKMPGFFLYLPVIRGAQVAVSLLKNEFDIIVCSHHYPNNPTCIYEKELWLSIHFPYISKCIFTEHKEEVNCDIMIDDRPKNINKARELNPKLIGASIFYPWTTSLDYDVIGVGPDPWKDLATKLIMRYTKHV